MNSNGSEKSGRFNWSIKWKLMAFITILVFSLVAILSYAQISNQKRILESGLENRIALMKANLIERGKGHIVNLSQVIENDLAAFDLSGVLSALEESVANNQEIQYAILVNAEGVVFADTHRPELTQTRLTGENDVKALACRSITAFRYHDGQGPVIEIISPVQISTEPWGVLRLIYTLRFLEAEIESSQKQIKQEIKRMIYSSMATSLGFLVVCLFIVFFLSSKFSKPLIQLTESAKKLAKGNFSVSSDIQINSHDELGVLGSSFIEMSKDLEGSYRKLEEYSNRYHGLFEYSPISLWEEDLSQVKAYLDKWRENGVDDLKAFFEQNTDEIGKCSDKIKLLDVNKATLELYEAGSIEELSGNLKSIQMDSSGVILKKQLCALADGIAFENQCVHRTLSGREINVLMKASIPPGYESTWSKVLISIHDLSSQMRAEFLKDMFGRYLSEEVTNALLENPDNIKLGGEKRCVTIMISDLRGFTPIAERLEPENVVQLLNVYFEVMVEVLLKYNATINEITGDELLVLFGAPHEMLDRAQRAIACAIEMQNAMGKVNEHSRAQGLPVLEMGIGLNEAEVIVGNIGSSKRSKYGVVGSGVNMTSRIESYTVGGQILISESVRDQVGDILRIDGKREFVPKGADSALTIYEVGGIGSPYNLALDVKDPDMLTLNRRVPVNYRVLDGKSNQKERIEGFIVCLSEKSAEIDLEKPLDPLTNIKMGLGDVHEELAEKHFYGKVVECTKNDKKRCVVRFTSVPPEIASYFLAHQEYAG